jgi:hypothetical protein
MYLGESYLIVYPRKQNGLQVNVKGEKPSCFTWTFENKYELDEISKLLSIDNTQETESPIVYFEKIYVNGEWKRLSSVWNSLVNEWLVDTVISQRW